MKGDEFLSSKVARPRLERIHQRADLLYLLDELRVAPLIMVSGLPGAGKTALVASYVQTRNVPTIWYQVDPGDEDLGYFFKHFDMAVRNVVPYKKDEIPEPTPDCLAGDAAAIQNYFRDLYRCLDTPFLLVFDKFNQVPEGSGLQHIVCDACKSLAVGGRIILIASSECPPTVACLRANGSAAILGWQEVQFNPVKVKEVAALHGLTLPLDDMVKQLRRKVGTWAADMVLAMQDTAPGRVS